VPLTLRGTTAPPSPEIAVEFAFLSTGAKIVDVPVLGVPGNHVTPVAARWQLRLERPVEFERLVNGETVITDEIFVGVFASIADARTGGSLSPVPRLRLFVAAAVQPDNERIDTNQTARIREGYAVDLHEVTVRR
jgi:hypothetical protein